MNILIIEDEPNLAHVIQQGLQDVDHTTSWADSGEKGLELLKSEEFDALILDIILPGISGWEVCQAIRNDLNSAIPILMLTALDDTEHVVQGLRDGADDYLSKPFKFKELEARIQAIARRANHTVPWTTQILEFPEMTVDPALREVSVKGQSISLTAREFDLLLYLASNPDRVITRKEILEKVWDIHFELGTNVVDVYISYLRNKVDRLTEHKFINTVVGVGYIFKTGETQ